MAEHPTLRRLLVIAGGVLLAGLASVPLFVLPAVDEPESVRAEAVDAVVVLGGGSGERLETALGLLPRLEDPPPQLLLSVSYGPPLLTCGGTTGDVGTTCLVPDPLTTSGEAAGAVELAAEQGWQRMVVVTSDFHVTRARLLFDRCRDQLAPDLEVLWVAGDTSPASLRGLWQIATEWPSLLFTPWDHEPACGEPNQESAAQHS